MNSSAPADNRCRHLVRLLRGLLQTIIEFLIQLLLILWLIVSDASKDPWDDDSYI